MSAGDAKKRITGVVKSKLTKVTRVEMFFVELGSFFRSPHHNVIAGTDTTKYIAGTDTTN